MALTEIGKQVKIKLINEEMTQIELAEQLGTTKQLLNNYLYGETNSKIDSRIKEWLNGSQDYVEEIKEHYRELNNGKEHIIYGYQTTGDDKKYIHISLLTQFHEHKELVYYDNELTSVAGKFSDWEIDYFRELLRNE